MFVIKSHIAVLASKERCVSNFSQTSPSLTLKNHLFCEYDKDLRPVDHKDKIVNVLLQLIPKFMEFVSNIEKIFFNMQTK